MALDTELFCTRCGKTDIPLSMPRYNSTLGCMLALLCLLPGVVYWALCWFRTETQCAHCGSTNVVPLDSPRAREALRPRTES